MTLADIDKLQLQAIELDGRPLPDVRMTEAEFENWLDEDIRAEWVNGEVTMMSPANTEHIELNGWLWQVLAGFAEHHEAGRVFGIEMQVRFPRLKRRRNPDLLFVSSRNQNLIKKTYIDGPPDLVMEIVSPDSESRDWRDKFIDYQSANVREYWIIDPNSQRVEAYTLQPRTKRYTRIPESAARIPSKILRGFYLRPEWLFSSPLPKVAAILKELKVR
ncbi:MAG TPA: Uma2 family endonuclease [Tepidisphaeraceae bacterium]|jgi:Uma2 family endonuclease|nr:Uma2 family endonuclease [Tepidisphaeraceae bacterium]